MFLMLESIILKVISCFETQDLWVQTCLGRCFLHPDSKFYEVGLGGLGITCSPRDPRFAGSNPVEVGGFFKT